VPSARQTTAPGAAAESADWAAETLEAVAVQPLEGGGVTAVTVQLRVAGEASALPAPSVALTENSWAPTASPEYARGELHEVQLLPSSLQAKVDPDSLEPKANEAVVAVVDPLGPWVIVVSGAVVSAGGGGGVSSSGGGGVSSAGGGGVVSGGGGGGLTVQLRVAGEASVLPAASVARTENWWSPVAKPE
jgi:uncharacterized membrane protein YgcG